MQKGTKNELETGRTFATIMSDPELRMKLLEVNTEPEFKEILEAHTNALAEKQKNWASEKAMFSAEHQEQVKNPLFWYNKYTYVIYDAVSRPFSTLCQVDHLNFSELDCLDSNNYYIWWHQQNISVGLKPNYEFLLKLHFRYICTCSQICNMPHTCTREMSLFRAKIDF